MKFRVALGIVVCTFAYLGNARGDIIAYELYLNSFTNPRVVIENQSDPGWYIDSMTLDATTANVVFDTTAADGIGTDPVDDAVGFRPVGVNGASNTLVTANGLASYSNAGNVAALTADINANGDGKLMTFNFGNGGLQPGDGWGMIADWDENASNTEPRGPDIDGLSITAVFKNLNFPTFSQSLIFVYDVSGNGVSFEGSASAQTNPIPEPSSMSILGIATVLGLGWGARKRFRKATMAA